MSNPILCDLDCDRCPLYVDEDCKFDDIYNDEEGEEENEMQSK